MFTGIIHYQGIFQGYRRGKQEIVVEVPSPFPALEAGESVALNGVCLTVARKDRDLLFFNLSQETLRTTTLGFLKTGEKVNLETALTLQSALGGHIVTGHVDGKGKVLRAIEKKPGKRLTISFPAGLKPYFIPKGSVAVNGVSLTIAELGLSSFAVELIPVTIEKSNLSGLRRGQEVNLECDIFGKYVYNWLSKRKQEFRLT
jgi:riboflavin synthase